MRRAAAAAPRPVVLDEKAKTTVEWAAHWGISRGVAQQRISELCRAKVLRCVKVFRETVTGAIKPQPGFEVVE